ncbi:MAG: penicillin-binding protein 1C [Anaerolineae bacterium]
MLTRFSRPLIAGLALLLALALGTVALIAVPVDLASRMQRPSAPSTIIYDRTGVQLYEILDPDGGSSRAVPLDGIPMSLRQAVIATEDASFYSNPGFSPVGLLRAAGLNLRAGEIVSGASTLTQQVARQLLLGNQQYEQSIWRKVREIWLAVRLTATMSKDEILSLYLNETYFGNLSYGVESAARGYFGKPVRELSLAESALLAGIPQSPVAYNPLNHPEAARARQRTVLDLMVKAGAIDLTVADRASRERLSYAGEPHSLRAPHFCIMVRDELASLVGEEAIARGGLQVHTTLDWGLQERAEKVVRQQLKDLNTVTSANPDQRVRNAAVVVLDGLGAVRVLVGSPDYWDTANAGAVNGATALRQPGSALKPFTYAAAFEQGHSPASPVADVRTVFRTFEGLPYEPANYDSRYHGLVSMRDALAGSYNIAAVRVLDTIGIQALPDMVRRVGIDTLNAPERQGLAITLGGAEVRLYDLTTAYAALAAGGRRVTPYLVERVTDAAGHVLYEYRPKPRTQAMDPRVAFLVTDILADPEARASVFGRNSALDLPFPAAVKTGTTTMWRDNWTIGYTPEWTIGVWVGNADGSPMQGASGITGAAPIWNSLMRMAHKETPAEFAVPDGLISLEVCALSGMLPEPACSRRRLEWFLEESVPTEHCDMHRLVAYDTHTGLLATEATPLEQRALRSAVRWPAEVLQWAIDSGLAAPEVAPSASAAGPEAIVRATGGLRLASPQNGGLYRISLEVPVESQLLLISAVCELCESSQRLVVELDGAYWQEWSRPPYTAYWPLTEGQHVLSLVYDPGTGAVRRSDPVAITVVAPASQGGNSP